MRRERHNKTWTGIEKENLLRLRKEGKSFGTIGKVLQRSKVACNWMYLHLTDPNYSDDALKANYQKRKSNKKPSRGHRKWTNNEKDLLIHLREKEDKSFKQISRVLKRTAPACNWMYLQTTNPKYAGHTGTSPEPSKEPKEQATPIPPKDTSAPSPPVMVKKKPNTTIEIYIESVHIYQGV